MWELGVPKGMILESSLSKWQWKSPNCVCRELEREEEDFLSSDWKTKSLSTVKRVRHTLGYRLVPALRPSWHRGVRSYWRPAWSSLGRERCLERRTHCGWQTRHWILCRRRCRSTRRINHQHQHRHYHLSWWHALSEPVNMRSRHFPCKFKTYDKCKCTQVMSFESAALHKSSYHNTNLSLCLDGGECRAVVCPL